jgi:POT family proton-dependent oligopeptide transporter
MLRPYNRVRILASGLLSITIAGLACGGDMSFSGRVEEIRTGFERPFWVANVSELFERVSYYGVQAVLAIYLHEVLKFSETQVGDLVGYFGLVVWFLPILGGSLADRFGFRRSLAFAYLILSIGYFLLGSLGAAWMAPVRAALPLSWVVRFVLLVPALGPAIVKPCVVGTTARASRENVRSLGYSIYYTLVNVGGMLGPIVAFLVRHSIGMENVFRVCALSVLLMFFGVLFFYREPMRSGEQKVASVAEALRNMFKVLGNLRFMLFLLIFSGFWVVFWQEFISLPLYIRGYVNPNSDVDLLLTFGPLAIILLQILVSYLTRGIRTFPAMTAGLLITSLAWIILAVSHLSWQISGTFHLGHFAIEVKGIPVMAVVALFVVAIGEMTQSPRYYEYISRLAPPGQQGTYMGYAFLPIGIGFFIGGAIGGRLVHYFGEVVHRPNQMWWVISGVGVFSTLLMIVYDRVVKPSTQQVSA